jgi:hypothetical protein
MVDGNAWKMSGRQEERVLQVGRRKREGREKEGREKEGRGVGSNKRERNEKEERLSRKEREREGRRKVRGRRIRRDGKETIRAKSGGKEGVKKEEQGGGKAINEGEWRRKGEGWEEEGRRKGGERDES